MRWESMEEGIGWEKARWMGIGNRGMFRMAKTVMNDRDVQR